MATTSFNSNTDPSADVNVIGPAAPVPPTDEATSVNDNELYHESGVAKSAGAVDLSIMLTAIVAPFIGFVVTIAFCWSKGWVSWPFLVMLGVGWLFSGMGVTIGFHRLLTHSSFQTYRPIRAVFMFLGALSVEGSPLVWCAVHRRHHALSDHPGDPHSPHLHGEGMWNSIKGFWYGHCGWLLTHAWATPDLKRYVPDLLQERLLVAVDRMYYMWVIMSLAIPAGIGMLITGGWDGALMGIMWGGLARIFLGHHITWSINSICHVFGQRQYETTDRSTNNVLCAILGFGEGWHNNHHAFPTSARHGLSWWQLDTSWLVILSMQKLGLAWNVKLPSEQAKQSRRITR